MTQLTLEEIKGLYGDIADEEAIIFGTYDPELSLVSLYISIQSERASVEKFVCWENFYKHSQQIAKQYIELFDKLERMEKHANEMEALYMRAQNGWMAEEAKRKELEKELELLRAAQKVVTDERWKEMVGEEYKNLRATMISVMKKMQAQIKDNSPNFDPEEYWDVVEPVEVIIIETLHDVLGVEE